MRPLTIRSRYQTAECTDCGETITVDMDADGGPAGVDLGDHGDDCPQALEPTVVEEMFKSLAVLVRTKATHDWLAANDPMALKQAKDAMMLYGRTYGSERCTIEWLSRSKFRRIICEDTEGAIRDRLVGRSR